MSVLIRASESKPVVVSDDTANATTVDFSQYAGAILCCPAGFPSVSVTPYVESNGAWLPLTKADGTADSITCAASTAVEVPVGIYPAKNVKFIRAAGSGEVGAELLLKK